MPSFVHGLKLNEGFHRDVVEPLMEQFFPDLRYSAGLVGHGSDVLGFDSKKSVDHDWGPHLHIFLSDLDFIAHKEQLNQMLREKLPYTYKGFPTHFEEGDKYLKHIPSRPESGDVNHLFHFWTEAKFFEHYLGFDVRQEPSLRDWLMFPQQALIEITSGELYRDDLEVQKTRDRFAYYPDDIWKYMMRVQWGKLVDELQMVARTGEEGDILGSTIIGARTVKKMMDLAFLQERKYIPYSKWHGRAFREWLESDRKLRPLFIRILKERDWMQRQKLIARGYQILGEMHNDLKITESVSTEIVEFFGRGYPVVDLWKFIEALEGCIRNPKLRNMKYPLGGVDQFIDHARINQLEYFYLDLKDVLR